MTAPPHHDDDAIALVGWLAYEFGHTQHDSGSAFLRVTEALHINNDGTATLVVSASRPAADIASLVLRMRAALGDAVDARAPAKPTATVTWRDSDAQYLAKIDRCKQHIVDGDAYLLCLTTQVHIDAELDPLATFLTLREINATPHSAFITSNGTSLLSTSPEQFLSVDGTGLVSTSPIKGTRARSADAFEDALLAEQLRTSEKERAENVMIVDLMRNDLARVCELGSVEVRKLFHVESYAEVHQLVSTIVGQKRTDATLADVIGACFPAGSMTGAPKASAMELLSDIEAAPRGAYAGAYGFIGCDGTMELSMTIRSIVYSEGTATIGTGGGITALSDPAAEVEEIHLKANALLRAITLAQNPAMAR